MKLYILLVLLLGLGFFVRTSRAADQAGFPSPWTSAFRVDAKHPHYLVNAEGEHLFILNKTAWAYFGCRDPEGVLKRARAQGVNVIRVALEGQPYDLGIEMWPWGGTRENPRWEEFNQVYWDEVERRVRLAGEQGIGIDLVLYFTIRPTNDQTAAQRAYWQHTLDRLAKYPNVLTWEICNEFLGAEEFQDAAGKFFTEHDPRPVCTSDGTTDDAAWPDKSWMGLAINHSCTSSRESLRDWYLATARRTRSHGKPAWCNESGRERRHGNDDAVHRRKQGWLWCASGCYWTYHSWEGCEGIDDANYRGPGQEFLKPMADFFRELPFWKLSPTAVEAPGLVATALTDSKDLWVVYVCTEESGRSKNDATLRIALPTGAFEAEFRRPSDGATVAKQPVNATELSLPTFEDDLVVVIRRK